MYETGHMGAAALVYAPLGLVAGLLGGIELAFLGGVAAVGLATVPDLDMRVPFIKHRGPTHTVWFAGLCGVVGLVGGFIAGLQAGVLTALGLAVFGFLVFTASICSHIAADALTPMGITPFTPVSSQKITYDIAKASNPIANYALLGLGAAACVAVFAVVTMV